MVNQARKAKNDAAWRGRKDKQYRPKVKPGELRKGEIRKKKHKGRTSRSGSGKEKERFALSPQEKRVGQQRLPS